MERFLTRHKDRIVGTITGFDRILFRGTLRCLSHPKGMQVFVNSRRVLLKDYGQFVLSLSDEISEHAKHFAAEFVLVPANRMDTSNWHGSSGKVQLKIESLSYNVNRELYQFVFF